MRVRPGVFDLEVADVEVGGDVHRVILNGLKPPRGSTAFDSRIELSQECDELRRLMISYPYGHEDMCANFIFETGREEAGHGYVIMESMGYPYYSGSNTIAVLAALLEYGRLPLEEGASRIRLESPGGFVTVEYRVENDRIREVTVGDEGVYVIADNQTLEVPGLGRLRYALVWSGAYYVMVEASDAGLKLDRENIPAMKQVGSAIIDALARDFHHVHHHYGKIEPPGFVHFMADHERMADKEHRGVGATYGHPGTVYHCPTGTGTSARIALMVSRGEMGEDAVFNSISAMGNVFIGRALRRENSGAREVLKTSISARPFVLATTTIHVDFENPLMERFANLREIIA